MMKKISKKKKRKISKKKVLRFIIILLLLSIFISPYIFIKINIIGDKKMIVNYSEKYSEPGYRANILGTNITDDIKVESNIKDDIGSYTVTYSYKFLFYNIKRKRKVEVKDIQGPNIILEGSQNYQVTVNTQYEEPGYKAIDNLDGDLSDSVKIENNIDINTIGEYEVIYKAVDSQGNETEVIRKVKVERLNPSQMSVKEYSLDGWYDDVKLKETKDMGEEYFNKIKIIGDSNIMNMYYNGYVNVNNAWAKPCLHAESYFNTKLNIYGTGEEILLLDAIKKYKPEIILLNLGTFSTSWIEENVFIEKSKELITSIKEDSPDTKIILCSLFPVSQNESLNNFSQEKINRYNFTILQLANDYDVKFLNVQEVLRGEDGYANSEYISSDKYHLSPLGHKVFKEYIKTHALEEE